MGLAEGRLRMMWKMLTTKTFAPSYTKMDYSRLMDHYYVAEDVEENVYPTLLPQWDRTPRAGRKAEILVDSTPEKFQHTMEKALELVASKAPEHRLLFLKAWNEWGEGDYVEPDQKYGHGWLEAMKNAQMKFKD